LLSRTAVSRTIIEIFQWLKKVGTIFASNFTEFALFLDGHVPSQNEDFAMIINTLRQIATGGTALIFGTVLLSMPAAATPFSGAFDPSAFTFDADGGDGFVDTSGAPGQVTLFGADDDTEDVVTTFSTVVSAATTFTFSWIYNTIDIDGPALDPFGYFVDAVFTQLTDDNGLPLDLPQSQSGGIVSVSLLAGQTFGFYIDSTDGCCGLSAASFGDAPVSPGLFIGGVPAPGALALLGFGMLGLGLRRSRT